MLKISGFRIDPVETPGLVHVDNLTQESARETTTLLDENNARYHIFTTTEDDKGVRIRSRVSYPSPSSLILRIRYTCTTTSYIIL
jgi:hypothetical protein